MHLVSPEGIDLEGKVVIIKEETMPGTSRALRRFKCIDGFGTKPFLSGKKILAESAATGERVTLSRWDVELVEIEDETDKRVPGVPVIDAKDLKWDQVREAVDALGKICRDASFAAPELHGIHVRRANAEVNKIAEALCLTTIGGG